MTDDRPPIFIPFDQAQPAADHPALPRTLSTVEVQPNPFDRFDPPASAASGGPDWSTIMIIARRLESLDANMAVLREALCAQTGMICAQTQLLAATLRLMAERRPPGEVEAALTAQVDGVAATIDPEIAPVFRSMIAMVKTGAGLAEPDAARVVH